MKILIIDDSRSVRAYLKETLTPLGAELELAQDGSEGLQLLAQQAFDLVLLDWEMPKLNGIDTLIAIRAQFSDLPVIMMTTRNSTSDIAKVISLGVNEYMMKPFTKDILVAKIDQVFGREVLRVG